MSPDDATDLCIRNHRPNGLASALLLLGLASFWAAVGGLCLGGVLDRLPVPTELLVCTLGIVTCGVVSLTLTRQSVRHWKLGAALVVWPDRIYRPPEVREVAFAPDPAEDFDDAATPARLCEVRARLRRGELRLIASVGDARRVRDWAVRKGIAVSDPTAVLEPARHDP